MTLNYNRKLIINRGKTKKLLMVESDLLGGFVALKRAFEGASAYE
jgi:hypothetical protein